MHKIYCSNCGKHISSDSKFCRYCGAPQHGPEAAAYRAHAPALEEAAVPAPKVHEHNKKISLPHEIIKRRHLSPRVIWTFFFTYIGNTAILLPLFAAAIFFEPVFVGTFFSGYVVITFLLAVLAFQNYYFLVDDNGFQNDYGIFHKKNVSIPFQQIQNVNINRTITDRFLGIARISIETAGSSAVNDQDVIGGTRSKSEGYLPGVLLADAKTIHDLLLQKANEEQS